jgi:hypothetical protein
MKNKTGFLSFAFFCLFSILTDRAYAQYDSAVVIPSINLSGPRIGVTFVNGKLSEELSSRWDANPVITQFGWQFETRFFTLPSGTAGLIEWVLLVGGLEQNLFLPSVSCLIGVRSVSGLEFGFGPNLSVAGAAFAFTGGVTLRSGSINFPINLAVVPSSRGSRISVLVGFNKRSR